MNFFNASINTSTYSLTNATAASGDYHEAYTYDGNCNILTLNRRGYYSGSQAQPMDSLTYAYASGTNRLTQLSDIINVANYSVDLDSVNNYTYDESGNLKTDAKEKISAVTWSPYGKIKNIAKSLDTVNIAYSYDASMNRVLKKYISASDTVKTYYVRDGQGNVLAVYTIDNDSLRWSEQHLYGSARLGLIEKNILLNSSTVNANKPGTPGLVLGIKRNERRFELTNHLGNVLSVISDVKRPKSESSNTYYDVDRIAVNDYYPFGMQMPGRKASLDIYRFGFNGKENDNEVKGEGNQQDYGLRVYDPRAGRWLSVDPLVEKRSWLSPYQFVQNNPVLRTDPSGGLDGIGVDANGRQVYNDGLKDGTVYYFPSYTGNAFSSLEDVKKAGVTFVTWAKDYKWVGTQQDLKQFITTQLEIIGLQGASTIINNVKYSSSDEKSLSTIYTSIGNDINGNPTQTYLGSGQIDMEVHASKESEIFDNINMLRNMLANEKYHIDQGTSNAGTTVTYSSTNDAMRAHWQNEVDSRVYQMNHVTYKKLSVEQKGKVQQRLNIELAHLELYKQD